jgi:hypothetical protein
MVAALHNFVNLVDSVILPLLAAPRVHGVIPRPADGCRIREQGVGSGGRGTVDKA